MGDVFRRDLDPERVPEGVNAKQAKVVVKITQVRRQGDGLDARILGALAELDRCTNTGWIVVTDDIEASEGSRELDGGKMGDLLPDRFSRDQTDDRPLPIGL